jgi:hypothetical protein
MGVSQSTKQTEVSMQPPEEQEELLERQTGLVSRSVLVVISCVIALGVVLYVIFTSIRTTSF